MRTGELRACPACSAPAALPFVRLGGLPAHGTAVFGTPEEARAVAVGDQELTLCGWCGVVFDSALDPGLLEHTGRPDESQHLSPHFAAYAAEPAGDWVARHRRGGTHVVEVGCGSGRFAAELLRAGAGTVDGIDPRFWPELVPRELTGRLRAMPVFFSPDLVDASTAALVCCHTFEHVPELARFGAAIVDGMQVADAPALLAEVPDLGRVLTEGAFWDLQYERCTYFTPATLAGYLTRTGLTVTRIGRTHGEQYVVAEAELSMGRTAVDGMSGAELARLHALCGSFGVRTVGRIAHPRSGLSSTPSACAPPH